MGPIGIPEMIVVLVVVLLAILFSAIILFVIVKVIVRITAQPKITARHKHKTPPPLSPSNMNSEEGSQDQ